MTREEEEEEAKHFGPSDSWRPPNLSTRRMKDKSL